MKGMVLAELVVALALSTVVLAGLLATASGLQRAAQRHPATVDAQQRARGILEAVAAELRGAGASVPGATPLAGRIPSVLAQRLGAGADPERTVRSDRLTILRAEPWAAAPVLSSSPGDALLVEPGSSCPVAEPVCGLSVDADVIVADAAGAFDVGRVVAVAPPAIGLATGSLHQAYGAAQQAWVAPVRVQTYYFDPARRQVRAADAHRSDLPLADDVVAFEVRFFGDARPPSRPLPVAGVANCLYDSAGGSLVTSSAAPGLTELTISALTDGPYCGVPPLQYDVDWLRVRLVRVRVRVQAALPSLRGADARFARPGTSAHASDQIADVELSTDVAPFNLQLR
jgi:hypothetical protein